MEYGTKAPEIQVTAISPPATTQENEKQQHDKTHWTPSFRKQFPWIGLGALLTILVCIAASVLVLCLSDDVSEQHWRVAAPNVMINIFNSVANLCFAIAIGSGTAISWWRMAMNGAKIEDLHHSHSFNTFIKEVFKSPRTLRKFNVIALAAVAAKLAIIDSTLLQKATSSDQSSDDAIDATITGFAMTEFPITGRVSSNESSIPGVMTSQLSGALKQWVSYPKSLADTFYGCEGICFAEIEAIGFEISCFNETPVAVNYGAQVRNYTMDDVSESDDDAAYPYLFDIEFSTYYPNGSDPLLGQVGHENFSYITMSILHTQSNDTESTKDSCPGQLYYQTCTLRPAVVTYPIEIMYFPRDWGSGATIRVGPDYDWYMDPNSSLYVARYDPSTKQNAGYKIERFLNYTEDPVDDTTSTSDGQTHLAGIEAALRIYLGGGTTLAYYDGYGLDVEQEGSAPYYLTNYPNISQCNFWYDNPVFPAAVNNTVEPITQKINEIMFSLAVDLGTYTTDYDTWLFYPFDNYTHTTVIGVSVHYYTNYAYMGGAVASSLLCVLLILPSFWGFWQLGRKVSLGPLEIVHAFRSPITAHVNDPTEDGLVKILGKQRVRYGRTTHNGHDTVALAPSEHTQSLCQAHSWPPPA